MSEYELSADAQAATSASPVQTVERERALAFSDALRTLLQRQNFYVPLTGTYLLPQFYERVRQVDGTGIHINTLRAYLRGETLPSDSKVRLLADALGVPRGVLLFAAGYLTAADLPNYPGAYTTLEGLEADMREVEALPLARETKERILHDLRTSARILQLLHADQTNRRTQPDEREQLIEQLIELWQTPAPPAPALTSTEEATLRARATGAPAQTTEPQPGATLPPAPASPAPAEVSRGASEQAQQVRVTGGGASARNV
jgi:transcriptional regulator with XRE-family HTH domain